MSLEFGPILGCKMSEECPLVISSDTDDESPPKLHSPIKKVSAVSYILQ